jgi:CelD/BcsL family acetyltransferase involved in cellulose biosynthesis
MELTSRTVGLHRLEPAEIAEWQRMVAGSPALASPFYSHAFAAAVARTHPRARVCVITADDQPLAFFPFQFANPLNQLLAAGEPIGGNMTDYFGIIADVGFVIEPQRLLRLAGLDSLLFHHLAGAQSVFGLEGEHPEIGHRMPIGPDPARYQEELKKANKSLVAETGRRLRKVAENCGPLRFAFQSERPTAELDHLIERKRAQYVRSGKPDNFADEWRRRLLHELVASSDPQCRGVLSTLHAGDTWVASHFGLLGGSTLHYWFPVYNDELAKFAPGHLLLKCIIDDAARSGIEIIDRGAGDQPHKTAYVKESHHFTKGYWYRASARGVAHRLGQAVIWRLQKARDIGAGEER